MAKIEVLEVKGAIVIQKVGGHNVNGQAILMDYDVANKAQSDIRRFLVNAGIEPGSDMP